MIKTIRANKRGFRTVHFKSGVNLVLADRSVTAGEKDTTNALGKSTLIEIIDFCLASNTSPSKGLRVEALQGWTFTLELTIGGNDVAITRSTDKPNFFIVEGRTADWPIQPSPDKEGAVGFDTKSWRLVLAWALFGIRDFNSGLEYKLSIRSLLSYFIRSQAAAYSSPF